jgi:hypothetical protein
MQPESKDRTLSREEMVVCLVAWQRAWNQHDLEGVLDLFDEDVEFDTWTGQRLQGKVLLRRIWTPWFANHGDFRFIDEESFVDEQEQKAVFRWRLEWPSQEPGCLGRPEIRRGIDILHFRGSLIVRKLSYSKTTITIDGRRVPLVPRSG